MSDQLIVERAALAKKDKGELQAIVSALGGSSSTRDRKVDLIDQILELAGATANESAPANGDAVSEAGTDGSKPEPQAESAAAEDAASASAGAGGRAARSAEAATAEAPTDEAATDEAATDEAATDEAAASGTTAASESPTPSKTRGARSSGSESSSNGTGSSDGGDRQHPVGPDGEPLADWELEVLADSQGNTGSAGTSSGGDQNRNRSKDRERDNNKVKATENRDDADPNNRRNRRRGRGRGREREEAGNEPISTDPVPVDGYLDLRDEGYGFLRVNGNLPSKEDVYVSVKQVRQYGLRKGDHLSGLSRPANRNEKNPGFHQIDSVNGGVPEEARNRVRFEDLTPVFPDERLIMELPDEPENLTTRILDLVAPIGKGQRGLIVSPPKSGKTSVLKDIVRAIEINNPEVHLMVLLVDERPEEVTDMRRHLTSGEVAASTFDRPPEEHCAVAELTLERAKRQVEAGDDVCIVLDGITRLARAYNLSGTQTGRPVSAGVDAGALYPAKRFFGAARNLEEGGSLTILATALVETGSKVDEAIFEEFIDTANLELRLDRLLADKRVFPAIDVDRSSTRNEELLFDDGDKELSWKLRRALAEKRSDNGSASASSAELLIERLKAAESNRAFLDEIAKAPSI